MQRIFLSATLNICLISDSLFSLIFQIFIVVPFIQVYNIYIIGRCSTADITACIKTGTGKMNFQIKLDQRIYRKNLKVIT